MELNTRVILKKKINHEKPIINPDIICIHDDIQQHFRTEQWNNYLRAENKIEY